MMGQSHAASGLLVGTALAAAAGSHPSDLFVCAAVGAGAALLPDLDEPGSTVGRSLGRITQELSARTRTLSSWVFRETATRYDTGQLRRDPDEESSPGGHRHLTHTMPAVGFYGLLAGGLSVVHPLGLGVVVFAMAALGLGLVLRSAGWYSKPRRRRGEWKWVWKLRVWVAGVQTVGVLAALVAAAAVVIPGGSPWLIGLTVAAGALTHVLGDWLTRSGVPLAWPLKHRGKRWWMFRSPLAFRTGKSKIEDAIRWCCLVGAPAVAVLTTV